MTSLRTFLDSLPESDILRLTEPLDLDYTPTALVVELEKRKQFPVIYIEQPQGFDMPVRIGFPRGVEGRLDEINSPRCTTAVGLLIYGGNAHRNKARRTSGVLNWVKEFTKKF